MKSGQEVSISHLSRPLAWPLTSALCTGSLQRSKDSCSWGTVLSADHTCTRTHAHPQSLVNGKWVPVREGNALAPFKKQGLAHLKCNSVCLHMRHVFCYIPAMCNDRRINADCCCDCQSGLQFFKWWCNFLSYFCNLNLKHSQDFRMSVIWKCVSHPLLEIERSKLFSVVEGSTVLLVLAFNSRTSSILFPQPPEHPGLKVQSTEPHLHICQCLECHVSV